MMILAPLLLCFLANLFGPTAGASAFGVSSQAPTSQRPWTIPTIDLTDPNAARDLRAACREVGFFYLQFHGLSASCTQDMLETSREFFAMVESDKVEAATQLQQAAYHAVGSERLHGLRHNSEGFDDKESTQEPDSKEMFTVGRQQNPVAVDPPAASPRDGIPGWPRMKKTFLGYQNKVRSVATSLCHMIAEHVLEIEDSSDLFDNQAENLRLNHYLNVSSHPGRRVACGDHTDIGFLTVLLTDHHPGLQVFVDGAWRDVPPAPPGTFVVNLGDVMERWSNGQLPSTRHRVITRATGDRYSIAFFVGPQLERVIECLPQFVSGDSPAQYEPIRFGDYLEHRKTLRSVLNEKKM